MASYLIAGGTKGIGKAFALKVLSEGHRVTLLSRTPPTDERLATDKTTFIATDFLKESSIDSAIKQLTESNSSFNYTLFFQRLRVAPQDDEWGLELQVSLNATRKLIEGIVPLMEHANEKAITVIASSASRMIASEQNLEYHIAKASIQQLVAYYAVTLGPQGIRANAISTGAVVKEESSHFYSDGKYPHDLYTKITPLKRMGHANDIANLASFLCSDKASFLTGQNIFLDGGLSLLWQESLARTLNPET